MSKEPSQWVVDFTAFCRATGEFLKEGGGTITTVASIVALGSVIAICVVNRVELPTWAQLILAGGTVGGIVYDPRRGGNTLQQQFQQPVDNVAMTTSPGATIQQEGDSSSADWDVSAGGYATREDDEN